MHYISLAVSALLIIIDQLSKLWAIKFVKPEGYIPVIKGFGKDILSFNYQENTGAAFSILQGKQVFLIIVSSIVMLGFIIVVLSKRIKSPFLLTACTLIIAGGLGNWIDRVFRHYVVDFIDFSFLNFAIFNFADCCAVFGSIFLFIYIIYDDLISKKKKEKFTEKSSLENITEKSCNEAIAEDSTEIKDENELI